jgi:hypothetical protein
MKRLTLAVIAVSILAAGSASARPHHHHRVCTMHHHHRVCAWR